MDTETSLKEAIVYLRDRALELTKQYQKAPLTVRKVIELELLTILNDLKRLEDFIKRVSH